MKILTIVLYKVGDSKPIRLASVSNLASFKSLPTHTNLTKTNNNFFNESRSFFTRKAVAEHLAFGARLLAEVSLPPKKDKTKTVRVPESATWDQSDVCY